MGVDIKSRLRNKTFILSIIAFGVYVVKSFTKVEIPSEFEVAVNMGLGILIGLGIVIDPSTPGISDKRRVTNE